MDDILSRDLSNQDEILKLQKEKLNIQFEIAKQSKFWAKKCSDHDVNIGSDPLEELKKLPLLSKEEVRENVSNIYIPNFSNRVLKISTSGTTGSGLSFYETSETEWHRWATWWRYRLEYGVDEKTISAIFSGRRFVFNNAPPFFRYNSSSRQIYFCAYNISKNNIKYYVDELNRQKPKWIHGYPSLLSQLSSLAISSGYTLDYKPTLVTIGSESLKSWQSSVISQFFLCEPKQHYGLAESVANFSQRPNDECLTIDEDFSMVEFNTNENGQKEIIGTNFNNPVFPLFRYKTGDIAIGVEENSFPRKVSSVDGRADDTITLSSGRKIARIGHVFKNFTSIEQVQLVQESITRLTIILSVNNSWRNECEKRLFKELNSIFNNELELHFDYSESFKRTNNGKIKFVVSEVQ